ncbi:SusC/RagA family TonB-linked outer membrane protein [Chitinophaga alhagiae]|uniref:SusC/RagA family TonB-linked outer membrane protein n=1 Tax=Chitinophaga alhagiae TaxID=2203219 RepID=UPI0018E52B02|nr:SusC/RagA family TonB-linked outer membrane protein [Chitinophaga alhagiae]
MRISILAALLTINGLLMAGNGTGQDLRKPVSIELKNASLKQALRKIEHLGKLSFTYKTADVAAYSNITYQAVEKPLALVLDDLLKSTDLRYEQVEANIIIKKTFSGMPLPAATPHAAPGFSGAAVYDGHVKGVVRDRSGAPVPFATITVVGTTKGTVADANGEFTLTGLKAGSHQLQASAVGFDALVKTVDVQDNATATLHFELAEGGKDLSEVVVTALGINRNQRSLGYATQQVDGSNLTLTKEQNVLGSLAGKIAGVQVVGASGSSMGGTQKIKIRGVNSISGGDQPLIVVDGTPISNANFAGSDRADFGNLGQDVNPEDIETINVLKGPAASALYGIRGQYGVIMITTKKGRRGAKKVEVQLNSAYSVEKAGNFLELQNLYGAGSTQTWRTLSNGQKFVQLDYDESWGPKMDGTPVRQVFSFYPQDPEYGKETPFVPHPNNIKDFYQTGHNFNNGITVAGGSENSTFRVSYNNTSIGGIEPNTWLKRNNLGVSAALDLSPKWTVATNINYANNSAQRPSQGSEWGARYIVQWFQRNLDMKRMRDYRYADGTVKHWNLDPPASGSSGELTDFSALYWDNPYFDAFENTSNDSRDRFFGDVGLTWKILPELKLSGFVRGDMYTQNIESRIAYGGRRVPQYSTGKYQNREMNYEFLAQYNKNWDDFSFNANLGGNIYNRRYSYVTGATQGGLSSPGFYNLAASIDRPLSNSYLLRKQIRSGYGMASFGYRNTYFVDASLRNDNSSALPAENNSYWYPSISGSFIFSEVMQWKPLSFGKLRLSYAQAGSDLGVYETSLNYGVGGFYKDANSQTNSLYVLDDLVNQEIKPSFAHSYEAGIDLKFFDGRLGAGFTYYIQKNKNQIIPLGLSGTSGYARTTINAGLIENKGIELTLTATPIRGKNFSWNTIFNLNRNRSMVVELGPGQDVYPLYSTTYSQVTSYLNAYKGQPFGSLIGKAYQRDSATGQILLGANNQPLYTSETHNFGSVLPDVTGGFQNMFQLGNFDLGVMIDYQFGGMFFSRSKMLAAKTGMAAETAATNENGKNVRDPVADGGGVKVTGISSVSKEPVTAFVDARTYYRTTLGTHVYEEWLYGADYIKLREIRLGYTLNKASLGKLPFSRVNIALIARNPAMLWQKAPKGLDPTELSSGSQAISWFESGQSNTVRSFGANLTVNF